ncbi:cytochrome b [Hydrogenovibrio sp. JE_KL2]|uniref:cytochrome b n=1 Tax=Hydrogenovibrio sp. JE_KL2 TaxID=2651188 RepID=UPI00352AA27A
MDTYSKLSKQTIFLHWVVATFMIALLAVGVYMHETKSFFLYSWHKSFGVLIVVFVVWRIVNRMKNGWLEPVRQYTPVEITLSKIVHWLLIIGTILMPISGMMMSGLGGYGIPFFGLELVAPNPNPDDPTKMIPLNAPLAQAGKVVHSLAGDILIGAVALHIAGALKHHFIDKDNTLNRMKGADISPK